MADRRHLLSGLSRIGTQTIIFIAALVLLIAAAQRLDLRWDLSASQRFTVSKELRTITADQQQAVELVAIWSQNVSQGSLGDLGEDLILACRRIAETSDRITFRHIDRDDRIELETFRQRHGDAADNTLYVVREGRRPFRIPVTYGLPRILQQEVGGALLALHGDAATPVYVLQGHGELRPGGDPEDGCDHLLRRLELAGFEIRLLDEVTLGTFGRIPEDGILLVPGPTAEIPPATLKILHRHLVDGGGAAFFLDDRSPDRLAIILRLRGLLIGPGIPAGYPDSIDGIFDPAVAPQAVTGTVFSGSSEGRKGYDRLLLAARQIQEFHPITRQVAASGRYLLCPRSTRVECAAPPLLPARCAIAPSEGQAFIDATIARYARNGTPSFTGERLFGFAPATSWLDSYAAARTAEPPANLDTWPGFDLAWAVTYQPDAASVAGDKSSRVVICGSRQVLCNRSLEGDQFANALLVTDACRWLADVGSEHQIPPQETRAYTVTAEPLTIKILAAIFIAVLPCLCLGAAMLTWWERRR